MTEWKYPKAVLRELRKMKLIPNEVARMAAVMDRFAKDEAQPKDHKELRDGVEELRISGDRRTIRLYFAKVDEGLVLLCLHVHFKKKDLDRDAVDLAADRLSSYLDGQWGTDEEE